MWSNMQVVSVSVDGHGLIGHQYEASVNITDNTGSTVRARMPIETLRQLVKEAVKVIGESPDCIDEVTDKLAVVVEEDCA